MSIITRTLSPPQRTGVRMIASGYYTEDEICEQLKISKVELVKWKGNPYFTECVNIKIDVYDKIDKEYRNKMGKDIIRPAYDEIMRRIENGDLKNIKITTLVKMVLDFNNEMRLDTEGDVTSKVAHQDLEMVRNRYREEQKKKSKERSNNLKNPDNQYKNMYDKKKDSEFKTSDGADIMSEINETLVNELINESESKKINVNKGNNKPLTSE